MIRTRTLAIILFAFVISASPRVVIAQSAYYMMSEEQDGELGAPWPFNPWPGSKTHRLESGAILVDDRDAVTAQALLDAMEFGAETAEKEGDEPLLPMFGVQFDTTDLWLEITDVDPVNNLLSLLLHNTTSTTLYQIDSTTNVGSPLWLPGEILQGKVDTNATDFAPISMTPDMLFFRAHTADTLIGIFKDRDAIQSNYSNLEDFFHLSNGNALNRNSV